MCLSHNDLAELVEPRPQGLLHCRGIFTSQFFLGPVAPLQPLPACLMLPPSSLHPTSNYQVNENRKISYWSNLHNNALILNHRRGLATVQTFLQLQRVCWCLGSCIDQTAVHQPAVSLVPVCCESWNKSLQSLFGSLSGSQSAVSPKFSFLPQQQKHQWAFRRH